MEWTVPRCWPASPGLRPRSGGFRYERPNAGRRRYRRPDRVPGCRNAALAGPRWLGRDLCSYSKQYPGLRPVGGYDGGGRQVVDYRRGLSFAERLNTGCNVDLEHAVDQRTCGARIRANIRSVGARAERRWALRLDGGGEVLLGPGEGFCRPAWVVVEGDLCRPIPVAGAKTVRRLSGSNSGRLRGKAQGEDQRRGRVGIRSIAPDAESGR